MDRDELQERLAERLEREGTRVVCAWLYGSRARGTARPSSDVDVALLLEDDPPSTLEGLELDLQEDLGACLGLPVQLVVLNRAPVDLVHRVLRDGRLVLENDRSRRIAFEVERRREFLDLLPVLEEYRRTGGGEAA